MREERIRCDALNEECIALKHDSGLTILLYPMPGYAGSCAMFGTHYGSIDRTFRRDNDSSFVTVPDGIAHYLEHKLFENEEGDAFSLFAQTGASANAYTSFERTAYYFSCTDHFEESLRVLLSFVRNPYFTDETVAKEQGIIRQEIKMYDDDPGWQVLFQCLKGLYQEHPVKIDVAGTIESIAKIDKELLYRCYETFYNLNNMVLAVAGGFDVEVVKRVVEELIPHEEPHTVIRKTVDEPLEVSERKVETFLPVSMPQFCIGYKMAPSEGLKRLRAEIECAALCELICGEGTELYRMFYETGLVSGGELGTEVFSGNGYFSVLFEGESNHPDKVLDSIQEEIAHLKGTGLSKEKFELVKKAMYGRAIRSFGTVDGVANNLLSAGISSLSVFSVLDVLRQLNLEEVAARLEQFHPERVTLSVVSPTKDSSTSEE